MRLIFIFAGNIIKMDYGNLDLRNKTFLDFTSDKGIIEKIIGGNTDSDKKQFLLSLDPAINSIADEVRVITFAEFSDLTPDKELKAAILKEFDQEFEALFDE